jgi:hypothetical protein
LKISVSPLSPLAIDESSPSIVYTKDQSLQVNERKKEKKN